MRDYVRFILVSGGRDHSNPSIVYNALDALALLWGDLMILHGSARGVDTYAEQWAKSRQHLYMGFPAQWDLYPKRAGMKRNGEMLAIGRPHQAVIFKGGRGTQGMLNLCRTWDEAGDLDDGIWLPEGDFR